MNSYIRKHLKDSELASAAKHLLGCGDSVQVAAWLELFAQDGDVEPWNVFLKTEDHSSHLDLAEDKGPQTGSLSTSIEPRAKEKTSVLFSPKLWQDIFMTQTENQKCMCSTLTALIPLIRSEERRVGKECLRRVSSGRSPSRLNPL